MPDILNDSSYVTIDSTRFNAEIRVSGYSIIGQSRVNDGLSFMCQWIQKIMAFHMSLTREKMHDATQFSNLISGLGRKYLWTDNNSNKIFNLLLSCDFYAIIPLRRDFKVLSRGSLLRVRAAVEISKLGKEERKLVHLYGKRWTVEIYFLGLKRVIRDIIKVRRME